jgi:hypothetical protein
MACTNDRGLLSVEHAQHHSQSPLKCHWRHTISEDTDDSNVRFRDFIQFVTKAEMA